MKNLTFYLVLFLIIILNYSCLDFEERYDHNYNFDTFESYVNYDSKNEIPYCIKRIDGGYLIAGAISLVSNDEETDVFLLKVDERGQKIGENTWLIENGTSNNVEYAFSAIDNNESIYIFGNVHRDIASDAIGTSSTNQMYTVITDFEGVHQNPVFYNTNYSERANSVIKINDNTFGIFGTTAFHLGLDNYGFEPILRLINLNGEEITTYHDVFGSGDMNRDEYGVKIIRDIDERFYLLLAYYVENETYNLTLMKTDESYNVLWKKKLIEDCADIAASVIATSDGHYLVAGGKINISEVDLYLVKVQHDGSKELWHEEYDDIPVRAGCSVIEAMDGMESRGYVVLTNSMTLLKVHQNGDKEWQREIDGKCSGSDCLLQDDDGGFILVGSRNTGNSWDIFTMKTDPEGRLWAEPVKK